MMWWNGALVLGLLGVGSAVACAQQTPAPATPQPADGQKMCDFTVTSGDGQTVTGKKPCAGAALPLDTPLAKRLPFPGEPPEETAPPVPTSSGTPANAGAPAAPTPDAAGLKDAGSSGESSSSSSSSAPAEGPPPDPNDPNDVNSDTPVAPKRNQHRKPPVTMAMKSVQEQVANDLQVAGFYMNDANWRGAYGRASDAAKLDDESPEAHLAVANAARKLGKLDEAVKEYKRTLALDPIPKSRKEAEKALKEMEGDG